MKLKFVSIMFVLFSMMFIVAAIGAKGHTASQLENAGYNCFEAGPHDWIHCMKKDPADGPSTIPVKVFSVDGSEFLKTELLMRADLYNGQPCPQEGGGEYDDTGFGYFACHHS